jgi:hypothetical protein
MNKAGTAREKEHSEGKVRNVLAFAVPSVNFRHSQSEGAE